MSASKMRAAVKDKNYDIFKMGIPSGVSEKDSQTLYNAVAKGMKVKLDEIRKEWGLDELEEAPVKAAKSKPPSKGLSPSQRRKDGNSYENYGEETFFHNEKTTCNETCSNQSKTFNTCQKSSNTDGC